MSTLNVNRIVDASGGVFAPVSSVFRSRIINGGMVIDQRNAGASVTPTNSQYLLDRWQAALTAASKFSVQQNAGSVTPPVGFSKYLGVTSLSSYSVAAGDLFVIQQKIEGFNTADLMWGTANAKTVTLSFQVYSSLTGTFSGSIYNETGTRRYYPFTYTVNSANTWSQISVVVTGSLDGTWTTDNSSGLVVGFSLGVGSTYGGQPANAWTGSSSFGVSSATSVVGTNGATFYITGVQLEVGTQATSFEYRQYTTELQLCQRYCIKYNAGGVYQRYGGGLNDTTTTNFSTINLAVEMRTAPTLTTTGTASNYAIYHGTTTLTTLSAVPTITTVATSSKIVTLGSTVSSGLTAGSFGQLLSNDNTTSYLLFSAEL
jgi:hypothetical protein